MAKGPTGELMLGLVVVVGGSVAIGATAPRWPATWLRRDSGPLRLTRFDRPALYERLGVRGLRRRFPEAGALFGGVSKNRAPDAADPDAVGAYLVEVRRAEWVHWLSMACWLPLPLFQRTWLAAALLVPTAAVNGTAQLILRHNKARLYGRRAGGERTTRPG